MPYDKISATLLVPKHFTEAERIDAASKKLANCGVVGHVVGLGEAVLAEEPGVQNQIFYYREGLNLNEEIDPI